MSPASEQAMKKKYVKEIKPGKNVDDVFLLAEKRLAQKKDGNKYLNVTLADKTGRIKGVIWDNVEQILSETANTDFVNIKAGVNEYQGKLQLVIKKMTPAEVKPDAMSDFLPSTTRDVERMFEHLVSLTLKMKQKHLKRLLTLFWNDQDFVVKFKSAPAAKKMHHAYIGGLLEHTLSMALLAGKIGGHYRDINQELLLTGVILHDIGKVDEFEYKTKIDYSDEGRLLNHIVIGVQMVTEKIKEVLDFPEDQALLLKHLIISHHGIREFGSPEPPKTIEAVLLNFIDEIDSRVQSIRDFFASEDPNAKWTSYHRLLERHFFRGNSLPDVNTGTN